MTATLYVDGVNVSTTTWTASTTFGTSTPSSQVQWVQMAGHADAFGDFCGPNGTYAHSALWNRAVQGRDRRPVAGRPGLPNENSGTRVARYLGLGGYTGTANIGSGVTTVGLSTLTEGQAVLEVTQSIQDIEFGNFYESQEGFGFTGRQARYLATTSAFKFGENVAAGEYPYLGDISYDFDPTYVYNAATITRSGGTISSAADPTGRSQTRYGPRRTFTRTVGGNSDLEATTPRTGLSRPTPRHSNAWPR